MSFFSPNIDKLKKKGDVRKLIQEIDNKSSEIRRAAISALAELGAEEAIPALTKLQNEDDRKYALLALKTIKRKKAINLISMLFLVPPSQYDRIKADLTILNEDAVEPLTNLLRSEIFMQRKFAAEILQNEQIVFSDPKDSAWFLTAIGDWAGAAKLGLAGVPALVNAAKIYPSTYPQLDDKNRALIARLLGCLKSQESKAFLLELLKVKLDFNASPFGSNDLNEESRRAAAEALGEMGDPTTVPYLIETLRDKKYAVAKAAKEALVRIGSPGVDRLAVVARDNDVINFYVSRHAVEALMAIGNPQAREHLAALIEIPGSGHREDIAEFLKAGPPSERLDAKVWLYLTMKDWGNLAALGAPAVDKLYAIFIDKLEAPSTQLQALEGLSRFGTKESVEKVVRILNDHLYVGPDPSFNVRLTSDPGLETEKQVMLAAVRTGDKRAASRILDWLFTCITERGYPWKEYAEDFRPCFLDYTDLILDSIGFEVLVIEDKRKLEDYEIEQIEMMQRQGFLVGASTHYTEIRCTRNKKALDQLIKIENRLSSNLLHKIAAIQVKFSYPHDPGYSAIHVPDDSFDRRVASSISVLQQIATNELKRRGNPPYDQTIYLENDAWRF